MNKLHEIKELLKKIQRTYSVQRAEYISTLQNIISDETIEFDDDIQQVLSDLYYDLNFYEEESRDRDEALGYYGEQRWVRMKYILIKENLL